ncbi:MAG TPA: hypothetical protein VHF02_06600 [Luteimonas sp.]|nr:hypothetical protein [Luteimonas sp.]
MKPNNLLMLAFALSTALFVTACDRNKAPADTAAPAAAVEPAPAPAPVAPPAPAAAAAMDSGMSFADMDKNKDGGITHDEIADTEMLHQHFDEADADHDGKLSQAEVDKHRADMAAAPGG